MESAFGKGEERQRERRRERIAAGLKQNTANDVLINANESSRDDVRAVSHRMKFIQINLSEMDNFNKIKDLNYYYYFYYF